MAPVASGCLKSHASTKPALLDFRLLSANLPRKKSRKSGRREGNWKGKTVTEPRIKTAVRFEKLHSAQGTRKPSLPSVSTGPTLLRLPPKLGQIEHGQFENSALKSMSVMYKMRQYSTKVSVPAALKQNRRRPLAVRDEILDPCKSALVFSSALL